MTRRGLLVLVALIVAVTSGNARAEGRPRSTDRRPYIIEIGEPYSINFSTVQREAKQINEMGDYLGVYGRPDYAEIQDISPTWPWASYEVRLFYLQRNLEIAFGHVFISPAAPELGVLKFQGGISPGKRHQIEVILQARQAPVPAAAPATADAAAAQVTAPQEGGLSESLVARIEAAAERAALAADRAAEQSDAATRAADRTVSMVDKMLQSQSPPNRRKH